MKDYRLILPDLLVNGGLSGDTHRPRVIQRMLLLPLGALVGRFMTAARFANSFRAVFGPETQPSAAMIASCWSLIRHNQGHRLAHRLFGYSHERKRFATRWTHALHVYAPRLRFIVGSVDPMCGDHMATRFRQSVQPADVVDLLRMGHSPQLEDSLAVWRAYAPFLAAHALDVNVYC